MSDEDDNIISFNSAKSIKSGDCRDWTVRDALEDALKQADEHTIVYIAMSHVDDDGKRVHAYRCAGGGRMELIGLLEVHKQQVVEDQ
jgi:hypothetical protein